MARVAGNKQSLNELEMVYNAVEDHIFENHKFCSLDEVAKDLPFHKDKCRKVLDNLLKSGRLGVVFEGRGKPTIYAPTYMVQEMLRTQSKPRWVENYAFEGKKESLKRITEAQDTARHYEMFERLLYGTSTPLEEVVAYALEYLEFLNVKHHKDEDIQDVSFSYDTKKYLLEIVGTTKQGDVEKVSQLHRWVRNQVDEGSDPKDILGIFVVNHFRHLNPAERDDPLTDHAKRYLKLYSFNFVTTPSLFDIVKKVHTRSLTKAEARRLVVNGQEISKSKKSTKGQDSGNV